MRNAIVTGAGSGIGQATAKRIAAEAGSVVCVDLFAETAEKTAAETHKISMLANRLADLRKAIEIKLSIF